MVVPHSRDPIDCTVHGILQARILEWVAFPFFRGSSQPRNQTGVSCIAGGFFTNWAMRGSQSLMSVSTFSKLFVCWCFVFSSTILTSINIFDIHTQRERNAYIHTNKTTFFFFAVQCGLQDLSSPTRDWTQAHDSKGLESC